MRRFIRCRLPLKPDIDRAKSGSLLRALIGEFQTFAPLTLSVGRRRLLLNEVPSISRGTIVRSECPLWVCSQQILRHRFPRSRKSCASISGISGRSREGNRVAHIGEARDVSDGALEAEAKTRVRHRTVAA